MPESTAIRSWTNFEVKTLRKFCASGLPILVFQTEPAHNGFGAGGRSYNRHQMLVELLVENYAVVEQARIRFHTGLNLLTGETGSGKSIVVDALGLLFGARASLDVVRSDAQRARVSGVFSVKADGGLAALLDEAGLELEDGELILERGVTAAGKSRAFAGNRPVTTQFLRQLAPFLGDIHGQNQQQALFTETTQRALLDEYARAGDLRAAWRRLTSSGASTARSWRI